MIIEIKHYESEDEFQTLFTRCIEGRYPVCTDGSVFFGGSREWAEKSPEEMEFAVPNHSNPQQELFLMEVGDVFGLFDLNFNLHCPYDNMDQFLRENDHYRDDQVAFSFPNDRETIF